MEVSVTSIGHMATLTGGFDFQHGASYWCPVVTGNRSSKTRFLTWRLGMLHGQLASMSTHRRFNSPNSKQSGSSLMYSVRFNGLFKWNCSDRRRCALSHVISVWKRVCRLLKIQYFPTLWA